MFNRNPEKTGLEDAIETALSELKGYEITQDQYAQGVDQIVKLHALKQNEKRDRVSKDTLVATAGNLLGILVIVGYESRHVITSKALNLLPKLR